MAEEIRPVIHHPHLAEPYIPHTKEEGIPTIADVVAPLNELRQGDDAESIARWASARARVRAEYLGVVSRVQALATIQEINRLSTAEEGIDALESVGVHVVDQEG